MRESIEEQRERITAAARRLDGLREWWGASCGVDRVQLLCQLLFASPVMQPTGREPETRTSLATLSQRCLLHAVSSYWVWNATDSLKALQMRINEMPTKQFLGN